MILSAFETPT